MSPTAKWTFMVYMAGDNNLSNAGDTDLAEMRKVGSSPDVNVIVQFDNAGNRGTQRFRVLQGGNDVVQSLSETDSGDPQVLLDFVTWTCDTYPAEQYALILWNHGGGWEPSAIDTIAQDVKAIGYSDRESTERAASPLRRAFFRPTLETILGLNDPQERAICSDDGSGHSLDTVELGKVLAKVVTVLGKPLDLLGMDACLMSNLEVAYQAKPFVRTIVASEESEPNDGWPYEAVLSRLAADPALSAVDFAAHIVHAYVQSYIDRGYSGDVTQAALDLSQLESLNTALDQLADALSARLPRAAAQIWKAHRKTKRFWHNTLADIGSFAAEIKRTTRDAATRQAADQVTAALRIGAGGCVIAEAHNGRGVTACRGITIYLPSNLVGISRYYSDLEYAGKHRWLQMLQAYGNA